ncbi:fibroleukin-like [Scleropages formosus]|uniref:Fibrinogen like 2 n=2 Tax=Scleropages formosus TaxID=113540 RepID=A0A8C9QXP5_SCLFO|nr:fibroleukin-like [Scleropages formosus]
MRSTLLWTCGTLLLLIRVPQRVSVFAQGQFQEQGGPASCPLSLRPAGSCGDGGECPYQITLPPLTVHLPKEFHLLEKTMEELQALKREVNMLRRSCLECQLQGDQILQRDSGTTPESSGIPVPTPTTSVGGGHPWVPKSPNLQEMQMNISKISMSLDNATTQIDVLHDQLEKFSLINMTNVENMVDVKVKNITMMFDQLNSKCTSPCPAKEPPKPKPLLVARDCSDYMMVGKQKNGVYRVRPVPRAAAFSVFCDMTSYGGGWTILQQRINGSVNFNRTWEQYKKGFGDLQGDFWLGNDNIHLLTSAKDMILRIDLEDIHGVREYAKYEYFYVANEFLNYRLSIRGYSGTAGDALHFSKRYNHDQMFFTTPDKDNDMYPSGNCGAYYSSGWWFDACMSANLNGKYYKKPYKGVRNGIFWGTWHNSSSEFYPTNYRQAFKTVKMMIRPKNYTP